LKKIVFLGKIGRNHTEKKNMIIWSDKEKSSKYGLRKNGEKIETNLTVLTQKHLEGYENRAEKFGFCIGSAIPVVFRWKIINFEKINENIKIYLSVGYAWFYNNLKEPIESLIRMIKIFELNKLVGF
jgi:hypothetical protein